MERRLRKVKTTMSIHAHRRTLELLDGEYASIHHGRSHDFDDLREYQPGDDVKDIDWKATARSHVPLVKRYIASRQHTLLLVVDSGRNMAAAAESGETKRDIAILVAGVLGYLATRHGDRVGLLMGDADRFESVQEGGSESHLERMLRRVHEAIALDGPRSHPQGGVGPAVRRVRPPPPILLNAPRPAPTPRRSPDVQFDTGLRSALPPAAPPPNTDAAHLNSAHLRPRSRGSLRLASSHPQAAPLIDPNYWADPHDRARGLEGLRIAREITRQKALQPFVIAERLPWPGLVTEAALVEDASRNAKTAHHPGGT